MGVISAMAEKELGERNFGFDSLKSRLNLYMEEKGIVAHDCLPSEPRCRAATVMEARGGGAMRRWFSGAGAQAAGHQRETIPENLTQSFEIHNIIWWRTQLFVVIMYITYNIDIYILYYII